MSRATWLQRTSVPHSAARKFSTPSQPLAIEDGVSNASQDDGHALLHPIAIAKEFNSGATVRKTVKNNRVGFRQGKRLSMCGAVRMADRHPLPVTVTAWLTVDT